jgi:hypothetical protein
MADTRRAFRALESHVAPTYALPQEGIRATLSPWRLKTWWSVWYQARRHDRVDWRLVSALLRVGRDVFSTGSSTQDVAKGSSLQLASDRNISRHH